MSLVDCTSVTPECPISATTYGYRPDLGGNAFFCAAFGLVFLLQLAMGIYHRTWTWMVAMVIGTAMECIGYAGRIMMNRNPWDLSGFQIQIIMLILAPSFLSASIDLTLKHIVVVFGTEYSHIKPYLYTWFFIGLDAFSIVMQAIGGGVAGAATSGGSYNPSLLDTGNNLMLAGICVQVLQMGLFGVTTLDYSCRFLRGRDDKILSDKAQEYSSTWTFRGFLTAVVVAYTAILTRCIYRIPEMASGWGKGLQRHEESFLILDGAMVLLAAILLTIFHPGYCFDQLGKSSSRAIIQTIKSSL